MWKNSAIIMIAAGTIRSLGQTLSHGQHIYVRTGKQQMGVAIVLMDLFVAELTPMKDILDDVENI